MATREKLTKEAALQAFEEIQEACDDPEAAHSMEDDITKQFVANIAEGLLTDPAEIKEIAAIIQKIHQLKFSRYYA